MTLSEEKTTRLKRETDNEFLSAIGKLRHHDLYDLGHSNVYYAKNPHQTTSYNMTDLNPTIGNFSERG